MQRNGSINSEDKVRKKHMGTGENEREMVGERKGEKKNRHTVSHALYHIHFELKASLAK